MCVPTKKIVHIIVSTLVTCTMQEFFKEVTYMNNKWGLTYHKAWVYHWRAHLLLQEVLTTFLGTDQLTEKQTTFNVRFSSIRSVIEKEFALLKGKWRRLKYLDMSDFDLPNKVFAAGWVLHKLIINQGHQEDEEIEIFDDMHPWYVLTKAGISWENKILDILNNLN